MNCSAQVWFCVCLGEFSHGWKEGHLCRQVLVPTVVAAFECFWFWNKMFSCYVGIMLGCPFSKSWAPLVTWKCLFCFASVSSLLYRRLFEVKWIDVLRNKSTRDKETDRERERLMKASRGLPPTEADSAHCLTLQKVSIDTKGTKAIWARLRYIQRQ